MKELYLQRFIEAIKSGQPINFPAFDTYQNDRPLQEFMAKVQELYIEYEGILKLFASDKAGEVKFVLDTLKKFKENRRKDAYDIVKTFFLELEYSNLSETLKGKFNEGTDIFENSIDYFCSYTTKGLPEINFSYENLLSVVFGLNKQTDFLEFKKTNYIAKLIVRYLNEHGFNNYFFDQDKIVNGDEIKDKVLDYCGRALVLVILAQQETFRDKNEETNWCLREYEQYNATHKGLRKYIVYRIPNLVEPVGARDSIVEWFRYISTEHGIANDTIEFTWTHHKMREKVNDAAKIIGNFKEDYYSTFKTNIA
ncbi:hypothetical protein SAMN04488109_4753 [Chryseolinea serpens]|uniref:TIR domain-containing protein n=1 Tax=Chryseolinea serpens TaxID=947013 RepID=A0A1M5UL52_9BACT|nr:hypothetical protein [Chryseolinea serpens]SHH63630.1 hypothetical protein SAMN04488109_4753 [Chryseolinea serpens]